MAFPQNPSDGDTYVNDGGTAYYFVDADNKWRIGGLTGIQGDTGEQGVTGILAFTEYDAGTMTGDKEIDWSDSKKQLLTIGAGATGSDIYYTNGELGGNTTLVIDYDVNETPTFTGIYWVDATERTLSGQTGVYDLMSTYYSDGKYLSNASVNFQQL